MEETATDSTIIVAHCRMNGTNQISNRTLSDAELDKISEAFRRKSKKPCDLKRELPLIRARAKAREYMGPPEDSRTIHAKFCMHQISERLQKIEQQCFDTRTLADIGTAHVAILNELGFGVEESLVNFLKSLAETAPVRTIGILWSWIRKANLERSRPIIDSSQQEMWGLVYS